MKRATLVTGGAVAAALVLVAGAVTVANAMGAPAGSSRVLDGRGIDTATVSPAPAPTGTRSAPARPEGGAIAVPSPSPGTGTATPRPGDERAHDGVVAVPPAGPTVIHGHGAPSAPHDSQGGQRQNGNGHGGTDPGAGAGSGSGTGSDGHGGNENENGGNGNGGNRRSGDDAR